MKYCCILNYSFGLFSISILCTGNLISMCAISRESTSNLYTVINMSFGFYSGYIFVSSVSHYSISNSSPFIVCKSDSTSVRGLWVLRIYILSISGGVLSSNWSLCLKLPLCLLILELDASNYRLVHTLNYRRFFLSLARSCFLIKLWPRSSISITSYLFLHLLDDESCIKLTCTTVSCTSFLSIVDLRDIIFWYIGYDKYMIEVNTRRHPANIMVMLKSFVLSNILPKIK